jgi:aminoglycoside phosphotransferase (APT) family kinase protein
MFTEIEQTLLLAGLDSTDAEISPLTGGVSSETFSARLGSESFVVKQALAQLNVAEEWRADRGRVVAEGQALEWFHSLTPEYVPRPIAVVEQFYALVLPMATPPSPDLRRVLLDSPHDFKAEWANTLGKILRTWHLADPSPATGTALDDVLRLTDLRITPFYRDMAHRWPEHRATIETLIDELLSVKTAVVHGDFTPKNILCKPDGTLWIIDTEVSHIGNPVIDTASMLAHLILKSVLYSSELDVASALVSARATFLSGLPAPSVPPSLGAHVGLFMGVRLAGRAQVPYMSPGSHQIAEEVARALLEGARLEEVGAQWRI